MPTNNRLTKIDIKWKANFKTLIQGVRIELSKQEYINSINVPTLDIRPTNSHGYYSKLFKIKNTTGAIYLWLDSYANHSRPQLSISYYNKNFESIVKLAKRLENFNNLLKIDLTSISGSKPNEFILKQPLDIKCFNTFIIENYKDENYLTAILSDKLKPSLNETNLINKIVTYINILTRINLIIKTESIGNDRVKENDKIINTHIRRERKLKYIEYRKTIDNYTCQVCKFNQDRQLIPESFAALEVHHLTPLSQSEKSVYTGINDLITVCANCHKMIHKMGGSKKALNLLKDKINSKRVYTQFN